MAGPSPFPPSGRGRDLRVNPRQTREPEILKGTPAPHRCLASLADDADAPIRQCKSNLRLWRRRRVDDEGDVHERARSTKPIRAGGTLTIEKVQRSGRGYQ